MPPCWGRAQAQLPPGHMCVPVTSTGRWQVGTRAGFTNLDSALLSGWLAAQKARAVGEAWVNDYSHPAQVSFWGPSPRAVAEDWPQKGLMLGLSCCAGCPLLAPASW